MKKISIEKIGIKENIRKDYGDLTELTASIKEHGMRNPVEINMQNELVDGFRRIKAAKAAGLTEIPYFINEDEIDRTSSQLLAGIFQKNLNPIEEGKAFRVYLDREKIKEEDLAKKISKRVNYIQKRLILARLSEDVQKALIDGKILMGHALLLARLTKQDSTSYLRTIIQQKYSVESAREDLSYSDISPKLSEANFNKTECKDCQYNGSKQSELFETGKILNGKCLNRGCFQKKVKQFVKEKRDEFKDVLYEPKSSSYYSGPKGYVGSHEWDCKSKGVDKKYMQDCRNQGKEFWLVQIKDDGEIIEYFKIPSKTKPKEGTKQATAAEEVREEKREQVLGVKIHEFKRQFLINKTKSMMKPESKETKSLALLQMIKRLDWNEIENVKIDLQRIIPSIFKKSDYGNSINVKEIFNANSIKLDAAIRILSQLVLPKVDMKELIEISRNFKVDIKKHFEITEDFLKLHTKDQLIELIEEFKLYVSADDPKVKEVATGNIKKGELISHILNQNLKGRIPKVMI